MPFSVNEAMDKIEALRAQRRRDRSVFMSKPASLSQIEEACKNYLPNVPADVQSLYMRANGLTFGLPEQGTFEIARVDQIYWPEMDLLMLHNWGTGDVDCAKIIDGECGSVHFCGHDPVKEFAVARSVGDWLVQALEEFLKFGEILHPNDRVRNRKGRMYLDPIGD